MRVAACEYDDQKVGISTASRWPLGCMMGVRLQGAAEIVLRRCVSVMDPSGAEVPLSDGMRKVLEDTVTSMASSGLRTLCLTARDLEASLADGPPEALENPPDEQLTLCCIVGIKVCPRKAPHPCHPSLTACCCPHAAGTRA
jgi:magnesium-transporting ATPase (P-type)